MSTHHDLWIVARARMRLLEHELTERQRMSMPSGQPRTAGTRRAAPRPSLLAANALHRLSDLLISLGRRLECYADRLRVRPGSARLEDSLGSPF